MKQLQETNTSILGLPKRNKGAISEKFRKSILNSNRYKVDVSNLSHLCVFAIKFMPDIKDDVKGEKATIIKKILPQIKEFIEDPIIKNGLIFSKKIPKYKDKTIIYNDYIIMIREVQRFDAHKSPEMLLYFLGNVMRKVMDKLQYVEVSNTKKFINMKKSIEHENLFIFSGFKIHFQLLDNGYYLTVDTTKKIIRNESVLEYINNIYKENTHLERDQKRNLIKASLNQKIIMTNYGKTRYLRIEDVLFIDLSQVIIESYSMPLPQYYKFKYDIEIKNFKQPLLYANSKKTSIKTYLVPELCLMTGIPENFDQASNKLVTQSARYECHDRKDAIDQFVKMMKSSEGDNVFPSLGIQISGESEKLEAKIIPTPNILLGGGKKVPPGRESSFPMHQSPILVTKSQVKLGIVTFDGIDEAQIVHYFYSSFKSIKAPIEICVLKADNHNLKRGVQAIEMLLQKAKNEQKCSICLILISNKMSHLYRKIKEICLIQKQINCQVVLEKTLKSKKIQSTALKIYLQILAKAGNTLWASVPQSRKEKIMLVAFYGCSLGKEKTNNFTMGICATCDDYYSQIFSKTKKFSKEHQQMQSMRELLLEALNAYKKRNKFIPEQIIILENAKSTRSEEQSVQFFIEPFNSSMQQIYGVKKPKITYIMMKKTLHDRFFKQFEGRYTNPPIGTLINSHLTTGKLDFYMVAHNVNRTGGSIIPLNYKIIFSDSKIEQGLIYSLLFSQCFSYANYAGAIRQPALIQNVTKCAKFVSDILSNYDLSEKMEMLPYYI